MFKKNRNSVVNHMGSIVYYRGEPHEIATSNIVMKDNQQIRSLLVRRKKSTRYRRRETTKQQLPIEVALDVE